MVANVRRSRRVPWRARLCTASRMAALDEIAVLAEKEAFGCSGGPEERKGWGGGYGGGAVAAMSL
jgi:hypothetical protein